MQMISFRLDYKLLIGEFYKFASPLFVFNSIAISVSLFDIWLLQKVSGSIQTGYYGLAYSIAAMSLLFTSAMTQIITREFSKSFASNDIDNIKSLFQRYIPMLYAMAAYFGVFMSFQSENLIQIFTDENFRDVCVVLAIIAFFPIHQTYGQLNGSLFFAMEETSIYSKVGVFVSLSGLILSYIFIVYYEFGAEGFALKMVLMQVIGVNIQLYFNLKAIKMKLLPFILHQMYTVVFFIIIAYISSMFPTLTSSPIANVIISGIFYTLFVIAGVFVIPQIFSIDRSEILWTLKSIRNKLIR